MKSYKYQFLSKKHFGRAVGAALADIRELDGYHIDDVGNWNMTTRRKDYSSQLPMKGMRVMAGHPEEKGCYFIPRNGCRPSEELEEVTSLLLFIRIIFLTIYS